VVREAACASRAKPLVRLAPLVLALALLAGCASPPRLDPARAAGLPQRVELAATPFHPQEVNHCGPAALASALGAAGIDATPEGLAPTVYLPARQGSLPLDMLGGARRAGAMAVRTAPDLESLLEHVAAGVPVVVLQNLSLQWVPMWHYAVVIGFDRPAGRILLRSGVETRQVLSLRTFEHTWARSGHWAMIAFRPGQLPAGVPQAAYTESAMALERLGRLPEARAAYDAGLAAWPADLTLAVGLANVAHAQGEGAGAEAALRRALVHHPRSDALLNNLAHLLAEFGRLDEALALAESAVTLAGPHQATARETRDDIQRRLDTGAR
jgi:hypothetical protein